MRSMSDTSRDWASLVEAARQWPATRALAASGPEELRLLLKAPAAVAWWIKAFAPELLQRSRLDLVIVGMPGGPAAADEGRPYQLLPLLLECPEMKIDASIILVPPEDRDAPALPYATPNISLMENRSIQPAMMYGGTLHSWRARRHGVKPDLCLLVDPAFDEHEGLWTDLYEWLSDGIIVGCFARGIEKVERDIWLLEAYGFAMQPNVEVNPWAHYRPELQGHGAWGAVGWRMRPSRMPTRTQRIDSSRLERSRRAQLLLRPEFEVWNPLQFIGLAQPATGDARGHPELFVGLPEHLCVSLRTGKIWALDVKGRVPLANADPVDTETLATYPGAGAAPYERLLWAVDLYRHHLRSGATLHPRSARPGSEIGATAWPRGEGQRLGPSDAQRDGGEARRTPQANVSDADRQSFFAALRREDWTTAVTALVGAAGLAIAVDEMGRTGLFHAFAARHHELARQLLDAGADPDRPDHEGFAVAHDLAKHDDPAPFELLQRYGANLEIASPHGFTPALIALRYESWTVLGYLLNQHVELCRPSRDGASVADQFGAVTTLPRVLRAEIEQQLGMRELVPALITRPAKAARSNR